MNATERRNKIEQLLKEKKEIEVSALNNMFNVSGVTIRNDLIFLERKGIAKRLFGKIVLENDVIHEYQLHDSKNIAEKEKIGKAAANIINPGDSVLFYAGSTTQQVVRFLNKDINLVAVTNSILIAQQLRNLPNVKSVLIGGNINHKIGATYGLEAIKQIKEYNYDKLLLAVDGIDSEMGITNNEPFESDINQIILAQSNKVIVIADYTKVGNVTFVKMGNIEDIDVLVTDSKASESHIEKIRAKGVEVIKA